MKKLIGLTAVAALAVGIASVLTSVDAAPQPTKSCAHVRCLSCPDGYHWRLQWPNCCECIPNR